MSDSQNQQTLPELIVEKRSGNFEKFDEEKLVRGISRAGTSFILAKDISKSILSRLVENPSLDNFIYSSKLQEYVTGELKRRNYNTIAESFIGYSKNKVTPIREELSQNSKVDSKVLPTPNTHAKQHVRDKDNTEGRETKRLQG